MQQVLNMYTELNSGMRNVVDLSQQEVCYWLWFGHTDVSRCFSHVLALKILTTFTLAIVFWQVSFHLVTFYRPQKDDYICQLASNKKEVKSGHWCFNDPIHKGKQGYSVINKAIHYKATSVYPQRQACKLIVLQADFLFFSPFLKNFTCFLSCFYSH